VKIFRFDELQEQIEARILDQLGMDFYLRLPNQCLLSGQEKFLTHENTHFRTVTISVHS